MNTLELATRLFAWSKSVYRSWVKDVFTWTDGETECFAIYGSSPRLEALVRSTPSNSRHHLDALIGKAFDIPMKVERNWTSPQFFANDDRCSFIEIVEGVESALREVLGEDAPVRFTVIPEGGAPYNDTPTRYYSVKRRKHLTSSAPPWVTQVSYRDHEKDITRPGANFCHVVPALAVERTGFGLVNFANHRETTPVIVAHSLDLSHPRISMATAGLIRECGGLLFPSLSVGSIPAANFGPLVLIADPGIVLDGLKPWRKRGVWPVTVYSTDTWTMRTSDFVGYASAVLYDQLVGRWEVTYYTPLHIWTLGPPVEHEGGPAAGRVLHNAKQLAGAIRKRMKPFHKIKDVTSFKRHLDAASGGESWYGYLEAKANAVMPMTWFVAAFCPDWLHREAHAWLNAAGFVGTLYSAPTTTEIRRAYDHSEYVEHSNFQQLMWSKQVGEFAAKTLPSFTVSA